MAEQSLCLHWSHLTFSQAILLGSLGSFPDDSLHDATVFWRVAEGSSMAALYVIQLDAAPWTDIELLGIVQLLV